MKIKTIICISCVFLSCWAGIASAAGSDKVGTTAAAFLRIGTGARPIGLAEAFVAVADDVNALYWNPAGIANLTYQQITATYTVWFSDLYYSQVGYVYPFGKHGVGMQVNYISYGNFDKYSIAGDKVGSFGARDYSIALSYGVSPVIADPDDFELSFGFTVKYINQNIDDVYSRNVAGDVGLLIRIGGKDFAFGCMLQNVGTKVKFQDASQELPSTLKVGISTAAVEDAVIAASIDYQLDNEIRAGAAFEGVIEKLLAIRVGYITRINVLEYSGGLSGLTAGIGLRFEGIFLDYAFVPFGNLGFTHHISFSANL